MSDKTGVHIVASTGFVGGDTALPFFERASVEYLTDQFVHEIAVGIGDTGAKAGIIKVGVSRGFKMKELDQRIYRAAARASKVTGAPIFTHLAVDVEPALAIFQEEGLPCDRVLFGHADDGYWLKGIDNGIMDEPAVKVHIEGTRYWAYGDQWPVKNAEYRPLYLRTNGKLAFEPEPYDAQVAHPEGFYQAPLTTTDKVEKLVWATEPFTELTSVHGVGAAHLFAAIDQDDSNFILRLWDEAPSGKRQLVTTGFLKASHRELDERTTEGNPYHPHTRSVPVEPGAINEYVIRLYPFANDFKPGHKLVVELMCNEPLVDEHNSLLPPDAFHLPVGRPVTHTIYRDAKNLSRLVLPFATEARGDS